MSSMNFDTGGVCTEMWVSDDVADDNGTCFDDSKSESAADWNKTIS